MGLKLNKGGRRWLFPGPIIALLLLGAIVTVAVPSTGENVGFSGLVVGLATASFFFYRRSRRLPERERRAWRLVSLAMALLWTGVVTVGTLTQLGVSLPAFGPVDAFFLGGYSAIIAALYQMARLEHGEREWVLTLLDALVGAIALGALVWNAFFSDLMASFDGAPWWESTIATIYPIADIMLVVGLLILVIRRSSYHFDLRLVFFATGATAQVMADFVFLSGSVGRDFSAAEPAWGLNLVATSLLLLTAAVVDKVPKKREFAEGPTPIWAVMWPYLLAVLLLIVHFQNYRLLNPGGDEILLLDAVMMIGLVIFLRQVYVIYRDRHRVEQKRSELVASVSHELRTPLTAMVGFLTLLDEHGDDFPLDARQEMISDAADQARHMSRLVADLLMLARGDTSYMTLEREAVGATSIVTSVLRDTDPGGVRIEEDLDADVRVAVDPDRMKQALANLLTNSIRYGGTRSQVVAKIIEDDLILEVHDNGDGIPTRFESDIWRHFERGAHRLDAVTPGLGIGLSIVQAVVEGHGGRAEYRTSERLGGACFSIMIPDCVLSEDSRPRAGVS